MPLAGLFDELAASGLVRRLIELARDEDLGVSAGRDATTASMAALRGADQPISASVVTREPCAVAGIAAVPMIIDVFGGGCAFQGIRRDGESAERGATLGVISGPASSVLALERVMLNLLSRLSGVATLTRTYVDRIRTAAPGTKARLLDTRKTTPGLRMLEKYAVRCGGGHCHRLGLYDAVLIKDNHLTGLAPDQLARAVAETSERARASAPNALRFVEVEVDTLDQLAAVLALPRGVIDIVLLDNMNPDTLRLAVQQRDRAGSTVLLEASGGVRLDTVAEIARTGVDRISAGALTHQAVSVDLGLDRA